MRIVLFLICLSLVLVGCVMHEYDSNCLKQIAEDHCANSNCIVVRVGSIADGNPTLILDNRTREEISFRWLPEEYEKCQQ